MAMRLLSVIPLTRTLGTETLSYYTVADVATGAVVKISLRKKTVLGLVTESTPIADAKTRIRQADFSLKKIIGVASTSFFLPECISAVHKAAELHATNIGSILTAIAPAKILEKPTPRTRPVPKHASPQNATKPPIRILQTPPSDRYARYKSMVRESFARNVSVFVLVPTMLDAETMFNSLSRGIEERSHLLMGYLSPRIQRTTWNAIEEATAPVLIVGTYSYLSVPRHDIGLYIVERESSPNYKLRGRPHLDVRVIAECLAHDMRAELILGDTYLSLETLHRYDEHEIEEVIRPTMKRDYTATFRILDMRKDSSDEHRAVTLLSPDALTALQKAHVSGKKIFVYAVRRGFAPMTVCKDCGKTLSCDQCDAPVVLHTTSKNGEHTRIFSCHRCGKVRDAQTVCDICGSWRLETLGLGVERIRDVLKQHFPAESIFEIHGDVPDIEKNETSIAEKWKASKGGILIGTERALSHVALHGTHTALIASLDSLIALPDFRMGEKIFTLASDIRSFASAVCLVQSRTPDYYALTYVSNGDGAAFYRHEKKLREQHGYPPYSVCVKVSRSGARTDITTDLEELGLTFAPRETAIYPAFVATIRNIFTAHLLITIPRASWPDRDLLSKLRKLSPAYDIDIAPRSFL